MGDYVKVKTAMNQNGPNYRHEAAPSQAQLVYRRDPKTGQAVEGHLRWGFIPHNAQTRPAVQPIHVRAETITDKPMFADAYRRRRCAIPMNSSTKRIPSAEDIAGRL